MNIQIIKSKYPKSYEKLVIWSKNIIAQYGGMDQTMQNNLPMDNIIETMVVYNPRSLYEFFDGLGINVIINLDNNKWRYIISETSIIVDQTFYNSRKEAEDAGFLKGFELLEKTLQ